MLKYEGNFTAVFKVVIRYKEIDIARVTTLVHCNHMNKWSFHVYNLYIIVF